MKQYTSKDQPSKLIELGFPKPTRIMAIGGFPPKDTLARYASYKDDFDSVTCYEGYSIGELIKFLPRWIKSRGGLEIVAESNEWLVMHGHDPFDPQCTKPELIDALFEYCVKIKETLKK